MSLVKQFRYYGENNESNYNIKSASEFTNKFSNLKILYLGIQTVPGIKFYVNENGDTSDPIIIGKSGVFEIDVSSFGEIKSLSFDASTISSLITGVANAYLIVDIVYYIKSST